MEGGRGPAWRLAPSRKPSLHTAPRPSPAPGPDPQTSPPRTPTRAGKSWAKGRNEPPHSSFHKRPIGSAGDSKAPPCAQGYAPRSWPWQTSWMSGGHGGEGKAGRRFSQSNRGELQAASSDLFPLIPWLGCRCKHRAEAWRARPQCKPGPCLLVAELRLRASWGES